MQSGAKHLLVNGEMLRLRLRMTPVGGIVEECYILRRKRNAKAEETRATAASAAKPWLGPY